MKAKNQYTYCPKCESGEMTMEKQGAITYHYSGGKFIGKIFDFPTTVYECLDCGWIRD